MKMKAFWRNSLKKYLFYFRKEVKSDTRHITSVYRQKTVNWYLGHATLQKLDNSLI